MTVEYPAGSPLVIDGLSYSDWEDDADRLRLLATGSGRVTKRHLARAEKLIASLSAELEAIDSVGPTLAGFDAIRVACIRDLLLAFEVSVVETQKLLLARMAEKPAKTARKLAAA